ncbi:MerR family transcriptional regulator [Corynebacterium hansenii]|uniref:MerR family transcriptional regulator n=1 Tax=Corynebacterium hansenii TaxID=394964 RepID=A0ABV7ZPN8_9CORY|nr:MerR family transcriptional regulator [Corynebacterium hansenii]WJY99065.1 Nodulation protein NolA [Corynebacterium hansenii]
MRVSELAGVAGVSVRTIRHYHAIGLMPVPPRVGAWRDYGVDDAARLLRIRALADAGIALSDMPAHLDGDAPVPDADGLDAAIASIDERIAELEEHRARLEELRRAGTAADGSGAWTSLPPTLNATFTRIEAAIIERGDARALTLLRRKRRLTEIAVRIGLLGDDVDGPFNHVDPSDIADHFSKFARLTEGPITREECAALVEEGFALIETFGPLPRALTMALEVFAIDRFAHALVVAAFPAPSQRMYVDMAFEELPKRFAAARATPAGPDSDPSDSSRPDSSATR